MRRRRLLAGLAVGSVGTAAGCLEFNSTPPTPPGEDDDDPIIKITEDRLVREQQGTAEETVRIEGIAENVSDKELSYVELRARFLDEEGELLDSTVENIDDVTVGRRWAFEIEYPQVGEPAAAVADYELDVVTNL
ncbi:FxLYD domain-containing protein [Haloferacaceae archaeon DSL9]